MQKFNALEYEPDSRCHYRSFRVVLDLEHDSCYTGSDYAEWVAVGRPASWCKPFQCHGDANGAFDRMGKCGSQIGYGDINILLAGFDKPYSGDPVVQPWIAADFDHRAEKIGKGAYRVGYKDISLFLAWFRKSNVPADCQTPNSVRP